LGAGKGSSQRDILLEVLFHKTTHNGSVGKGAGYCVLSKLDIGALSELDSGTPSKLKDLSHRNQKAKCFFPVPSSEKI
jgi:hypothetical protein